MVPKKPPTPEADEAAGKGGTSRTPLAADPRPVGGIRTYTIEVGGGAQPNRYRPIVGRDAIVARAAFLEDVKPRAPHPIEPPMLGAELGAELESPAPPVEPDE